MEMEYVTYAAGAILILIGLSFGYKCLQAIFWGRVTYWKGFLPFTLISPFFIHLPSKKGSSLIKSNNYWWVHITLGPIFFLISLAMLGCGADLVGLPGSQSISYVLNLGRNDIPSAIIYNKDYGYRFPIVDRLQKDFIKMMNEPVVDNKNSP